MLQFEGRSKRTNVTRGVLQGDPLSGPLFILGFEYALRSLSNIIGYTLDSTIFNAIAYADDVLLLASTQQGMTQNITSFNKALNTLGLRINITKSMALSMVPSGREKKIKILTNPLFKVDGVIVPQINTK